MTTLHAEGMNPVSMNAAIQMKTIVQLMKGLELFACNLTYFCL
jgi:hypothetical protein